MPVAAKRYAYGVIAIGGVVLALSLRNWSSPHLTSFIVYFIFSIVASMVKFTPPGIDGTYSLSFLLTLIGIAEFTLPETLAATCAGAVIQCLWKVKQRPLMIQVLFSVANLTLSTTLCFAIAHGMLGQALEAYRPAVLALVAAVHFAASTILVSGVLSLLEGKRLHHVYRAWYFWSFPYYLIGAAVVGLLPLSGKVPAPEGWLILLPLLYLVHFYYRLRTDPASADGGGDESPERKLPANASLYIDAVISAGAMLVIYAALHWESQNVNRFLGYMAMALLAGTYKVRLPRLRSTISVSFVLILVAVAELSHAEAVFLSAAVALVQTVWKAKRPAKPIRIIFNCASLVLSTSVAFAVCRALMVWAWPAALPAFLVIATALLFGSNNALVAAVMCLSEGKPMNDMWQQCYFWSFPYYLVGAAASGLMIATARTAGWPFSFLVLPILTMIYVSYRLHARPRTAAQSGA
ncbi:MAG: hypothetical protein DMG57_37475 [Acidobacteria bacterium]|nr:MAG: hypothetical protein DMG57_37475 [Acidobacteriota bacterium]